MEESNLQRATSRPRPAASRRRDKPQLSCNAFRRRKGRCDRQVPCSSCLARGHVCTYPGSHATSVASQSVAAPIQGRLEQLERLVLGLMQQSSTRDGDSLSNEENIGLRSTPGPPSANPALVDTLADERSDCGSMRVSDSELRYIGSDHWAAILENIADLKDHFDREEQIRLNAKADSSREDLDKRSASSRALLLYGSQHATSQAEILASLPSRSVVDRYVSGYFNRLDLVAGAVHGPTFLRQYAAFWANPSDVPIMWIGLLFSMICLAVQASEVSDIATSHELEQRRRQIEVYREKVVQCLLMGEYTKSGPYVLETVIHYVYIEFCLHPDADRDIWFLLSLEANLARRMGYHRYPSHFPGMSPFQGEMRRRVWVTVLLGDTLISSQMGMPRMISDWQCDTAEPRNLNDGDLDADAVELPLSRPESDDTTTLCLIARRQMLMALGRISDQAAAVQPCSYDEIIRLDGALHEAAESVPPPLKMKPMADSLTDPPRVIMERLLVSHKFYKGQLMLHRRFFFQESATSKDADMFVFSRGACIDAALGVLNIQKILDEETGPDGQLHSMHWRITSILNHQFLTATMILCSLLHRRQTQGRESEILIGLRHCQTIWMRRSPGSEEARMAADVVNLVLSRTVVECNNSAEQAISQVDTDDRDLLAQFTRLSQTEPVQLFSGQDENYSFLPSLTNDGETFSSWMLANPLD